MTGPVEVPPDDIHNRTLVDNVHPGDWANPEPAGRYNLVVIGAGTAGLVAAAGAAGLGAKVALVERHLMGGDCLNYGCVPSKGIISSARAAASVRDAADFGVNVPDGWTVDFPAAMQRMRELRAGISGHDSAARFRDLGIDVFLGGGQFAGPDTVAVVAEKGTVPICAKHPSGRSGKWGQSPFPLLRFSKAVIATGARAAAPPIPGLDEVEYLTNETVFSLTELPGRIGIIGAGPIGCELAQTFARLGSEVFLVEATHGILPREDPEASEIVKNSLLRDGVHLLCCGRETKVRKDGEQVRLYLESHGKRYDEPVDKLLVAVGRAPNVEALNLEAAGVEYDSKAGVQVDDKLQTSNPRIFAAGDMISEVTLAMTHGLGLKKIAEVIHPYPTQAEAIRKVGDLYNRSRLTPFVKSLFQKWLAWTR